MIAYKGVSINEEGKFYSWGTSPGMVYEIGETYNHDGDMEINKKGFHFCKKMEDVCNFKIIHYKEVSILEIEVLGDVVDGENGIGSVTNKFKVLRELPKSEWKNCEFDERGNLIHYKNFSGSYWLKRKLDKNDNETYIENSFGQFGESRFDEEGYLVYRKNSDGTVYDKSVCGYDLYRKATPEDYKNKNLIRVTKVLDTDNDNN